jgi:hypothetical protein
VIRQSVSCDVCGTEKRLTNHWFVALDTGGELRLSGLNLRSRARPDAKHLCGQTCLHKMVDDFVARTISSRIQAAAADPAQIEARPSSATDTGITAVAPRLEPESSARLLTPVVPSLLRRPPASAAEPAAPAPAPAQAEAALAPIPDEAPHASTHNWRAEAWQREREREQRSGERQPEAAGRR